MCCECGAFCASVGLLQFDSVLLAFIHSYPPAAPPPHSSGVGYIVGNVIIKCAMHSLSGIEKVNNRAN